MTKRDEIKTEIDFDDDEAWLEKLYHTSDYFMFGDYVNTSYSISLANMEQVMIKFAADGILVIDDKRECSFSKPDYLCDKEYEIYKKLDAITARPYSWSEAEDMGTDISKLPSLLIDEGMHGYKRLYIRKDLDVSYEFSEDLKDYPLLEDSIMSEIESEASFHDWMREGAANAFPKFFINWYEDGDADEYLTDTEKEEAYDIFSQPGTVDTICEGTNIYLSVSEGEDSNEYREAHEYLTGKMEAIKEYKDKKELSEEIIGEEGITANPVSTSAPKRF